MDENAIQNVGRWVIVIEVALVCRDEVLACQNTCRLRTGSIWTRGAFRFLRQRKPAR